MWTKNLNVNGPWELQVINCSAHVKKKKKNVSSEISQQTIYHQSRAQQISQIQTDRTKRIS